MLHIEICTKSRRKKFKGLSVYVSNIERLFIKELKLSVQFKMVKGSTE